MLQAKTVPENIDIIWKIALKTICVISPQDFLKSLLREAKLDNEVSEEKLIEYTTTMVSLQHHRLEYTSNLKHPMIDYTTTMINLQQNILEYTNTMVSL